MNKPHKHAELIKAWADGAEIEVKIPKDDKESYKPPSNWTRWEITKYPEWRISAEYRIKPKPVLCRLYKRRSYNSVHAVSEVEKVRIDLINSDPSVKWITPWFNPEDIKEFK